MAADNDELEPRVAALEDGLTGVRERVEQVAEDAAAARVLAAAADRDVSEVRAELRAHRRSLEALRDTQLDMLADMHSMGAGMRAEIGGLRAEIRAEFGDVRAEMRSGFATVGAGMSDIVALLTRITPDESLG